MILIDSHSHLDFSEFDNDRADMLNRAKKSGVSDIIISATTAERWPLLKNLKQIDSSKPECHIAYGLHPMFMSEHKLEHLDSLKTLLEKEEAIAVGEIGLDFFIPEPDMKKQIDFFTAQLAIANELNLPVIIHARKSQDIVLKYLRQFPNLRGSLHSFSGSEQQAKQLIDLGFYLGFGGPITYTRATKLRKLVSTLPLEALLIETDSPDQPDALHFGERNEPAYLPNIAETIAQLRGISIDEVARITTYNTRTLFKLEETFAPEI